MADPQKHTLIRYISISLPVVWECRLILWFLMSLPAVREWYEFIQASEVSGSSAKLGPFAWIAVATTCLETMISIKFGRGLYPNRTPRTVAVAWGVGLVIGLAGMLLWVVIDARRSRGRGRQRAGVQTEDVTVPPPSQKVVEDAGTSESEAQCQE